MTRPAASAEHSAADDTASAGSATTTAAPRGPRASLRELLPYLFEQRRLLVVALVLGLVAAVASLVQPPLLGQIITRVTSDESAVQGLSC